jgi:Fe-S cluster biogenesis protein NfuA
MASPPTDPAAPGPTGTDPTELGTALASQFDRMVRRDGGTVALLGVDDGVIRVSYRPGGDPTCDDGSCVLPQVELQQLMAETLARRDGSLRVVVELVS